MRVNGTTLSVIGGAALLLAGCSYNPSPVLVHGAAADIAALGGSWEGTYVGKQSLRSGTIQFMIRPGKDTAFGDVLMENGAESQLVAVDAATGEHYRHARSPQLLMIHMVAIHDGLVEGILEPYIAPDCQCIVNTVFRGRRAGEEIAGDFTTRGPFGLLQSGTWSVRRTKTTIAAK